MLNTADFKNILEAVYFLLLANLVGKSYLSSFQTPCWSYLVIYVKILVISYFCGFQVFIAP